MFKRLKFLTLGLALVLPLAACDDDEPPPIVDPVQEIGNISGAALIEGAALPGATIAIAGPQASTAVTDAGGAYSFNGVPVGAYTVTISGGPSDITFATSTVSVTVTNGGTATADFAGTYIRTAALAIGVTVDTGDGPEGVAGVPITITGTESFANQTDETGQRTFTGLRKGSYTIEIDVTGLPEQVVISTSQTATLDVGQTIALVFAGAIAQEPTVSIASVVAVPAGGIVNPAAVLGTIAITVNHDAGDDQATRLALLLNDVEVDFQTFSSTGVAGLEGPARTPGDPVMFAVFTAEFDPATFLVTYPNGQYTLSAQLTTSSGKVATATLGTPHTFANLDVLTVRHTTGGKGVVAKGVRWWGAEDINFEAVVIIYSQAISIADIGVTATGTLLGKSANSTSLSLDLGSGHGAQQRNSSAPFTYTAKFSKNAISGTHTSNVEDVFLGFPPTVQGQTLKITSVRDASGIDILPDFTGPNTPLTGFMVDFVAPVTNVGTQSLIGVKTTDIPAASAVTGVPEWYSKNSYSLRPSSSITEFGVGGKNTTFDIDDRGTGTTDPDFTGIAGPGSLPENDNGPGTGFVAELVALVDDLGNSNKLTGGQSVDGVGHAFGANHSDEHGTDFNAPVTSKIFPAPGILIVLNPDDDGPAAVPPAAPAGPDGTGDNNINWDTDDPKLADASVGSGMHTRGTADLKFKDPTLVVADPNCEIFAVTGGAAPVGIGSATIDYAVDLGAVGGTCFSDLASGVGVANPLDIRWDVSIKIPDLAVPANSTTIEWDIIIDATDPTTNMLNPPPGSIFSTNTTLTFTIAGNAVDANGLSSVLVNTRISVDTSCTLADPFLAQGTGAGQVEDQSIDVTASAKTGFSVPVVLHNPGGVGQKQNICFFIESEDEARDNKGELEPNRSDESALTVITWN